MATLKDVARLACVDASTVSRALNGTSYVHPDTKARIFAAIKELSYQPNLMAKGLRQGKRFNIGVLIPSISLTIFAEITQAIEVEARKFGYGIIICNTDDIGSVEKEGLLRLTNGFVDGIIIAPTGENSDLVHKIKEKGIPIVQLVRKIDKEINSVSANYYTCGYEGTQFLISKGCKNIGLINGALDIIPYRERYDGYCQAIKKYGYSENVTQASLPHSNSFAEGYRGTNYLLENNKDLDGLLVAADMQGIGAIRLLKERGIMIPDSIKLVSLTGHSIGGMLETSMTSLEMPAIKMGERAARLIIEEIDTLIKEKKLQHIVYKSTLVERETT